MRPNRFFYLFIVAAACAFAQTGTVGGPSAGLVFDSSAQAVRPIRGVPGAATFGPSIEAGLALSAAWFSPAQDSLFARDSVGQLHYFQAGGSITENAINGLAFAPERVVFSPTGSAAALYASGQIQVVTGLPGSPKAAPAFALAHGNRGARPAIGSMSVSDDGAYLVFAAGGSIQLADASEGSRVIATAGFGGSVAFAPGAHDVAVAAQGTGVEILHDAPNTAAPQVLAADDPAFSQIAGLAFSGDGRQLYIASASNSSVVSLDASSGARTDFACSCSLTGLSRMGQSFRLTDFSTGPLWLFDPSSARIVFVPAWKEAL